MMWFEARRRQLQRVQGTSSDTVSPVLSVVDDPQCVLLLCGAPKPSHRLLLSGGQNRVSGWGPKAELALWLWPILQ